jgi:hypothetical protein
VRPPIDEAGITAEWLTAALHERGHLPPSVKVAKLEPLVNIGEGRGYANYSWKLVAHYDKPVAPDMPTKFVLKQLNQSFAPNWEVGGPRILADKSYCLEAIWYEKLRDLLPIPQPKLWWSGCESPANPAEDLGVYGVLMEWLGDDLKKVETQDGTTEEETVQAMTTLAKLHASFWCGFPPTPPLLCTRDAPHPPSPPPHPAPPRRLRPVAQEHGGARASRGTVRAEGDP